MRRLAMVLMVFLFSIGIIGIACSSSTSEPTEEGLEQRDQAWSDAFNEGNYSDMYRYFPPEFKEACAPGEFVDYSRATFAEIEDYMKLTFGLDDGGRLHLKLVDVLVEGTNGFVEQELSYQGDVLYSMSSSDDSDNTLKWKFIDGEWFMGEDDPDEDCE